MSSRKYTSRKNSGENKEINGIIGLILIIISVFFLICLIITPILSTIGYAVKGMLMGLMGYFSYPFFVCMLFIGISIMRSMKVRLSGKNIVLLMAIAITLMFLLQTVTMGGINGNIDEYISYIWSTKNTVGGLIFGVLAYSLQMILTKVGAVVFYVALLVVFLSLLIYSGLVASGIVIVKNKKKSEPANGFVRGQAPPQMVTTVHNNDLYVDVIQPKPQPTFTDNFSEAGVASKIRPDEASVVDKYSDKKIEYEKETDSANSDKERARKILFGDKNNRTLSSTQPFSSYSDTSSYSSSSSGIFGSSMKSSYSRSNAGYDEQIQFFRKMSENRIPDADDRKPEPQAPERKEAADNWIPEKDISSQYVGGLIINGDEVAAKYQQREEKRYEEDTGDRGGYSESDENYDRLYNDEDEDGRPPIINGDYVGVDNRYPKQKKNVTPNQTPRPVNNSYYEKKEDYAMGATESRSIADKEINKVNNSVDAQTDDTAMRNDNSDKKPEDSTTEKSDNRNVEDLLDQLIQNDKKIKNFRDGKEFSDFSIKDDDEADAAIEDSGSDHMIENEFNQADRPINPTITHFEAPQKIEINDDENISKDNDVYEQFLDADLADNDEKEVDSSEHFNSGIINGDDFDPASGFNFIDSVEDLSEKEAPEEVNSGYYEKVYEDDSDTSEEKNDDNADADKISWDEPSEDRGSGSDEAMREVAAQEKTHDEQQDLHFSKMQDYANSIKPKNNKVSENQIDIDEYLANNNTPENNVVFSKKSGHYTPPNINLLKQESTDYAQLGGNTEEKANILESCLDSFKFPAKVIAVVPGPAVTRYELEIPRGVPIKKIEDRAADLEYELESNGSIRIETPIPGKKAVGVEVPNKEIGVVGLKDIIGSKEFKTAASPLTLAIGKDIAGEVIICNLEKMPHLLIAGSTNSGKSSCLNCIITSIIYKAKPEDVRLVLIDPKQVEFTIYAGIPHLLINDIIKDAEQSVNFLKWAIEEMENRYALYSSYGCRNIKEYNALDKVKTGELKKMPFIVIIVDEFSALMGGKNKEIEDKIIKLAQKSRACGIHLILATQRPSVDIITGTIKANLPSRIAFAVTSNNDSRIILDKSGAETLLGRGDMLYFPIDYKEPKRVQGAYIDGDEIAEIVNTVKAENKCVFYDDVEQIIKTKSEEKSVDLKEDETADSMDPLIPDILKCIIDTNQVSATMIQSRFSVGYARAARILDQMETHQFVGPSENKKPRKIYITREMYEQLFGNKS